MTAPTPRERALVDPEHSWATHPEVLGVAELRRHLLSGHSLGEPLVPAMLTVEGSVELHEQLHMMRPDYVKPPAAPIADPEAVEVLVLHERLDRAGLRARHGVNLLWHARDLYARGVRVVDCSCLPFAAGGSGPEIDCPVHGAGLAYFAQRADDLDETLAEVREELRSTQTAARSLAEQLHSERDRAEGLDAEAAAHRGEIARLRGLLDEVHG